jgi:Flp pilus assembly protein TadG
MRMFRSFLRAHQGIAAIEFAFIVPLLLLMIVGGVELARFSMAQGKLQSASFTMANMVAQLPPVTTEGAVASGSSLDTIALRDRVMSQFTPLMDNFGDAAKQGVMITSVQKQNGAWKVLWQVAGGGTCNDCSMVSVVNGQAFTPGVLVNNLCVDATFNATINAQLAIAGENENLLMLETAYRYTPFSEAVLGLFGLDQFIERTFTREVFFYNRRGRVLALPGETVPASSADGFPVREGGYACPLSPI